jgi:hypothetical protein
MALPRPACDVLMAVFHSYDQAANTLDELSPRSRRRDDS